MGYPLTSIGKHGRNYRCDNGHDFRALAKKNQICPICGLPKCRRVRSNGENYFNYTKRGSLNGANRNIP